MQGAATFAKGIELLQLIAEASEPPLSSELQARSGWTRPTLHRLLKALEAEGLVRIRKDRRWGLGPRLIPLAARAIEQDVLANLASPELDDLQRVTGASVHLATCVGMDLIYSAKREGPPPTRLAIALGGRVRVHASALGRAVLASLPELEREEQLNGISYAPLTPHTVPSAEALRAKLGEVAERGYCVTVEEAALGICCYGAAILDAAGRPQGGLSLSVLKARWAEGPRAFVEPLLEAVDRISARFA